jgi:hypothetical protein
MKSKGSPLPIPILGDDLKRVSDTNPCRKTGGGCPPWVPSGGYHFAVICIDRIDSVECTGYLRDLLLETGFEPRRYGILGLPVNSYS